MKHVGILLCTLSLGSACPGEDGSGADPTTAPATSGSAVPGDTSAEDDAAASEDADDDRGTTAALDDTTTRADEDTTTATADESTGADRGGGLCDWSCSDVSECIPLGADPTAYACTDGFCKFLIPTCKLCSGVGSCVQVDAEDACVIPCPNGDECAEFELECTGVDDAGNAFCESPPCDTVFAEGEPCSLAGYGQNGVCRSGVCSCIDDTECTVAGTACNLG